jgi:DNA repair protein SbcD/Mre11
VQPFAQLRLARDGLRPGFRAEVDRIVAAYALRVVDMRVTANSDQPAAALREPLVRLADLVPEDLFNDAFQRTHGMEPEAAHRAAFHVAAAAAAAADT